MIIESNEWAEKHLLGPVEAKKTPEKTDRSKLGQLVNSLAERMDVDYEKLLEETKTGADFEKNANTWLRLVSVVEGSEEAPATTLITKRGPIKIIPGKTELPPNPDTPVSIESALYGVAMSLAKLKTLQPVMDEVYPNLYQEKRRALEARANDLLNETDPKKKIKISALYALAGLGAIAALAACSPAAVVTYPVESTNEPTTPLTSTIEAPTYTVEPPTATATATELPPTPEKPPFVPEHFEDAGMLINQETNKSEIAFNSEADWNMVYEMLIGGLWELNTDAVGYQPNFNSDASRYSSKEEFIEAVKKGTLMNIGIPVRIDSSLIPKENDVYLRSKDRLVILENVTVNLNKIKIRIATPTTFKKITGKPWNETGQEAYDSASYPSRPGAVAYWEVDQDDGSLILTVGSFFNKIEVYSSNDYNIGDDNPELYNKWPQKFKRNGHGIDEARAASFILGATIDELHYLADVNTHVSFVDINGQRYYAYGVGRAMGYWEMNTFYWDPAPLLEELE